MGTDQLKELKRLQKENERICKALSDLTQDALILKEVARENFIRPCARTVYGWPLGKSFVLSSGVRSVAAMYTASDLRHDVPRALMKSAGSVGSRSMARALGRSGPNWVSLPFYLRLVPSPHVAPHHPVSRRTVPAAVSSSQTGMAR
jgi:hypothetical protein